MNSPLASLLQKFVKSRVVVVGMDEGAAHVGVAPGANLPGDPRRLIGNATLAREGASARVTVPPVGTGVFRVR